MKPLTLTSLALAALMVAGSAYSGRPTDDASNEAATATATQAPTQKSAVWVSDKAKSYRCGEPAPGSKGTFVSEAEAKTRGLRPESGKNCPAK